MTTKNEQPQLLNPHASLHTYLATAELKVWGNEERTEERVYILATSEELARRTFIEYRGPEVNAIYRVSVLQVSPESTMEERMTRSMEAYAAHRKLLAPPA